MFWGSCYLSLSWDSWNQSTPSHLVSLRSIFVLSSHLRLSLPGYRFPAGCSTIALMHFSFPNAFHMPCPSQTP
jgi:hypothetical protein